MNTDERYVTHDAVLQSSITFDDAADGITTDDSGDVAIDWDSVERVSLSTTDSFNDVPHGMGFDSTEFYRLQATVARPIPQPYVMQDDSGGSPREQSESGRADSAHVVWLKKPRAELQKAAWSLDNRPWTMGHPDTGLLSDVNDARGFWDDTYYNETVDDLKSYLHVPVNDDEAKEFIEDNGDVSVGFRNRVAAVDDYDEAVGGEGPDVNDGKQSSVDALDGYQVDMYFDHVASVKEGRCNGEDGCGIDSFNSTGNSYSYKGGAITNSVEDSKDVTSVFTQKQGMADQSHTGRVTSAEVTDPSADASATHEGSWYAVTPDENPDDEYKYVIDNCSDAEDAWKLRNHGDIDIEVSTLESRIKDRASDLGCDLEFEDENTDNMTDCGCTDGGMNIDIDDLSAEAALDKITAEYDSLESHLTELRDKASVAEDAADELDTDVEDVADTAALLDEKVADLESTVDELQRPQMEEDAEAIAEATDRFGESADDVMEALDEDPEAIADKRELVEDLTDTTTETTANADGGADDFEDPRGPAVSPWD